jgi:hypothetical protein
MERRNLLPVSRVQISLAGLQKSGRAPGKPNRTMALPAPPTPKELALFAGLCSDLPPGRSSGALSHPPAGSARGSRLSELTKCPGEAMKGPAATTSGPPVSFSEPIVSWRQVRKPSTDCGALPKSMYGAQIAQAYGFRIAGIPAARAKAIDQFVAFRGNRQIFYHPDSDPLSDLEIPIEPRR